MPQRVPRPCAWLGCPRLVRGKARYCPEHQKRVNAAYDAQRGSPTRRGYDARWRRLRQMFLAQHPLCADPYRIHAKQDELVPATEVDHIKPKRDGGMDDWNNLQALCKPCHSQKTAIEDGRWGGGD